MKLLEDSKIMICKYFSHLLTTYILLHCLIFFYVKLQMIFLRTKFSSEIKRLIIKTVQVFIIMLLESISSVKDLLDSIKNKRLYDININQFFIKIYIKNHQLLHHFMSLLIFLLFFLFFCFSKMFILNEL